MKTVLHKILKYSLFFLCECVVCYGLVLLIGFLSRRMSLGGAVGVLLFSAGLYIIARGIVATIVFKTFEESVITFSTISAFIVFAWVWYVAGFSDAVWALLIAWVVNVLSTFIPCSIYDEYGPKRKKEKAIKLNQRYPYLETNLELSKFEKARTKFDDVDADRQLDYTFFKDMTAKNITGRGDCFGSACIAESKSVMESIANEGVYYLMHFIALGALSAEKGERVDFVEMELRHIQQSGKLELLKCRINEQCFAQMEEDLQRALEYYSGAK